MKNERTQTIALAVLFVAVVTLTIAYAAMSQQLNITASATVANKSAAWNVHFTTATCTPSGKAQVTTAPTTSATDISGLAVKLRAPGDSVTCTFNVQNEGTLNAKISSYTAPTGTVGGSGADKTLVQNNIQYSLVYGTGDTKAGSAPAVNDTLNGKVTATPSGQSRPLKLTIAYKSTATDLPSTDVSITNIHANFTYAQV